MPHRLPVAEGAAMPIIATVRDGHLTLAAAPTGDLVPVGGDAWRQWLRAPETTSFRFEDDGVAFSARRELRRGQVYWYAYRRRGPRVEKAYLGRSDEIDLDRLQAAARRLAGAVPPDQPTGVSEAPPSRGFETSIVSHLPAPATRLIGREQVLAMVGSASSSRPRDLSP